MSEQIVIDNGLKTYRLVNENGDLLCEISFNPTDTDIVKRYEEVKKDLNRLKNNALNSGKKKNLVDELSEIDRIACEKIDYLFNAKISESIFSIMGPFSPLARGQFFVEHIMDVLAKVIAEENDGFAKKIQGKISKYTSKYHN